MQTQWIRCFSILVAGALFGLAQTTIKKTPIHNTPVDSGASMYHNYCASCHGADGRGNGPAAPALKSSLPDLTVLSRNNNGTFPAVAISITLGRIRSGGGHGSQEMPIWGDVFRANGSDEPTAQLRIYNLTRYIEQIQQPSTHTPKPDKPAPAQKIKVADVPINSGASMFASFCASCHGATAMGDGPSSASLKIKPANLTMLSKNNGGKFPVDKVTYTLGMTPGTVAHGSSEMPVWGDVFRASHSNPTNANLRINNLVEYLKKIQK